MIRILADSLLSQNHNLLINSFVVGLQPKHIGGEKKRKKMKQKEKSLCTWLNASAIGSGAESCTVALRVKRFGRRAGCTAGPLFQETRDGE